MKLIQKQIFSFFGISLNVIEPTQIVSTLLLQWIVEGLSYSIWLLSHFNLTHLSIIHVGKVWFDAFIELLW